MKRMFAKQQQEQQQNLFFCQRALSQTVKRFSSKLTNTESFPWTFFVFPDDPPEYNKLYAIPALAFLSGYGYCAQAGTYPDIHQMAYLAASLCCVGALTGLSSQTTSRLGKLCLLFCVYGGGGGWGGAWEGSVFPHYVPACITVGSMEGMSPFSDAGSKICCHQNLGF